MDDFDADLPDDPKIEVSLSADRETVVAVDRHGHTVTVPRYGSVRQTETKRGISRWRHKVVVDECSHLNAKAKAIGVYCPDCDASRGPDGLWRVLEVL